MFYAVNNRYSTETDLGFYNTWFVLAFDTKKNRDAYVENSKCLAVRAIKKSEIKDYVPAPKPFTCSRRAIVLSSSEWPGVVGVVELCWPNEMHFVREL